MRSLKIQTALTFLLLLVIGMLLVELVAMQLWRRDALRGDREQAELLLDGMAARLVPEAERGCDPIGLAVPASDGAVLCLGILDGEGGVVLSPHCDFGQTLADGLRVAASSRKEYRRRLTQAEDREQPGGIVLMAQPVRVDGASSHGAVGMIRSLAPVEAQLRDGEITILGYVLVNAVLLAALGVFRIIRLVVRPLENLAEQADLYSMQHEFLPSSGRRNEFGRLESSLHKMVARLEQDREDLRQTVHSLKEANAKLEKNRQEMMRAEKQASAGRLAAGLAHEIGNPLGIMQGYLDLLRQEGLDPDEKKDSLNRIEQELGRVNRLIRQLLDFARPAPGSPASVHVQELAQQAVEMFRERGKGGISYSITLRAGQDMVMADPDGLRQVLVNCLLNAEDAILSAPVSLKSGRIEVYCENSPAADASSSTLRVKVRDNGPGIAPEHLANIFEPFFTTKEVGKGTGLGLSVSAGLVAGFGGEMGAASQPGEGTEIWFSLPLLAGDENCAGITGADQNG